jgi:site-specific DNA-methyltransferase (adenine-specific)
VTHEIKLIDAVEGLRGLATGSVQFIATDPAYESLNKWREMGTTTRLAHSKQSSNDWFPTVPYSYFPDFFQECYRVLDSDRYMNVLCDEETADKIKPMIVDAGFHLRKSAIWHKVGKLEHVNCPRCGTQVTERHTPGTPGMGYPFRSSYEFILLAEKGHRRAPDDKKVRNFLEIIDVHWIKGTNAYPTEKPVELLEILIRQLSDEGDLVVDPFAGSGSCGEAAFNLRRDFVGFDVEQKSLDYFKARKEAWSFEGREETAPKIEGGIFDMFGG